MEQNHKAEMKRTVDALISECKFDGKNVFVFGHCNATEEMLDYLFEKDITAIAILDNSESKQGSEYKGVPIVSPLYIKQFSNGDTIVLIATRFFEPMSAQLKKIGCLDEIVRVVDYNSFAEYSVSNDAIKRKTARMLRGIETLNSIRVQFPQHHLVICPNCALGDVYWTCAYLPAYCTKNKIEQVAVIVIGNGCCQVAELFGISNLQSLDQAEMDELVQATIFRREDNCLIAHHDRPYTDNIVKYLNEHFLTFTDYYKYAVFGLSQHAMPVIPTKMEAFTNRQQLIEGRSVIIAPYAKSVVQPTREFWDKMVYYYSQQSLQVFTNVFGAEEPLPNTKPVSLPLRQLIHAVEYAGHFVGLRSGLCDVVREARCRKTVIMPDCFYSTTSVKVADFFTLPGWEQLDS